MPNCRSCVRCGKSLGGSSAKLSDEEFLGLKKVRVGRFSTCTKLKFGAWRLTKVATLPDHPVLFSSHSRHAAWLDCGLARECAGQPRACKKCASKGGLAKKLKDFTVVYAGVPCHQRRAVKQLRSVCADMSE